MTCLNLIVKGRVQGVFFRHYTRKRATDMGLTGWVKNLDTGDVEIIAEGTKEALKALLEWVWEGSPSSDVVDIKISWKEYTGRFREFEIEH